MSLNKMDKIHAFKAMMTVARAYELSIPEEYEETEEHILIAYDLSVYDMMGSLKHIHQDLKEEL